MKDEKTVELFGGKEIAGMFWRETEMTQRKNTLEHIK